MIYDTYSNLELNLKMLIDLWLLSDGHYKNITQNKSINGLDASRLVIDSSAANDYGGVSGCQVWQSPFQNWVYESGISLNQSPYISGMTLPIIASGIYVNNTFFTQASGVSGMQFFVDYTNGRIVFAGTGIPSNSIVQSNFAYKFWRTDWEDNSHAQLDVEDYGELAFKDNPYGVAEIYPSGDERSHTFPCIYINVLQNGSFRPLEVGNRSQIEEVTVELGIYAISRVQRNSAIELLKNHIGLQAYMIDFNYAPLPLSGLVNTLSPAYIPYQTMVQNPVYNGNNLISWTYDINNGEARRLIPDGPFLRGEVVYHIDIYNIAPTGRVPNNPYLG